MHAFFDGIVQRIFQYATKPWRSLEKALVSSSSGAGAIDQQAHATPNSVPVERIEGHDHREL
jgi:hypothetical protein